MPFHPILNNNLALLFDTTKFSAFNKTNTIAESYSFKAKPRDPIYNPVKKTNYFVYYLKRKLIIPLLVNMI